MPSTPMREVEAADKVRAAIDGPIKGVVDFVGSPDTTIAARRRIQALRAGQGVGRTMLVP